MAEEAGRVPLTQHGALAIAFAALVAELGRAGVVDPAAFAQKLDRFGMGMLPAPDGANYLKVLAEGVRTLSEAGNADL